MTSTNIGPGQPGEDLKTAELKISSFGKIIKETKKRITGTLENDELSEEEQKKYIGKNIEGIKEKITYVKKTGYQMGGKDILEVFMDMKSIYDRTGNGQSSIISDPTSRNDLLFKTHKKVYIYPNSFIALKVDGTENKITSIKGKYFINGGEVLHVGIGNNKSVCVYSEGLKKLRVKGTNEEINDIGMNYEIGGENITRVYINNKEGITIDTKTFNKIKLKIDDDTEITNILDNFIIQKERILKAETSDKKIVFINPKMKTRIDLKIDGTEEKIVDIKNTYGIGEALVLQVITDKGKEALINPETMKVLMINGTNDIITNVGLRSISKDFGDIPSIGEREIQKVKINNKEQWIYVYSDTLDAVKIDGINSYVTKITPELVGISIAEYKEEYDYIFKTVDGKEYKIKLNELELSVFVQ